MEDVKLEFPSLPQCKEDAEVSLSVTNTHRPLWLFAEGRTPGPNRRSLHLLVALLPSEGVSGPRGGVSRFGAVYRYHGFLSSFRRRWGRVWSTYFSPFFPKFGVEDLLEVRLLFYCQSNARLCF